MTKNLNKLINLLVIIAFAFPMSIVPTSRTQAKSFDSQSSGLMKTSVSWQNASQRERLNQLSVSILQEGENWANVVTTGEYLESLARLGYQPQETTKVSSLAQASESSASSIDDDGDGLTNTQEQWWCTNPEDPDTDADGKNDGDEIKILKDWVANKRSVPPGETPWPSWPFNSTTCPDKDHDSIPNLAEKWELGLNMDLESTDRDKFDDGQEVLGVTYCPGGDNSCGYGELPRSTDSGFIGATLPSWVKAPGNHPLVAAFPIPEIDVVQSSLKVTTVTDVTTDHVISSGTEKSYSTEKTEGISSSEAETTSWNEWQEVSTTNPLISQASILTLNEKSVIEINSTDSFLVNGVLKFGSSIFEGASDCFSELTGELSTCGKIYDRRNEIKTSFVSAIEQSVWDKNIDTMQNLQKLSNCMKITGVLGCVVKIGANFWKNNHEKIKEDSIDDVDSSPARGSSGINYSYDKDSEVVNYQTVYQLSYPIAQSIPTITESNGKSWGGAHTTTQTVYEEQTITNGEAFSSEEAWGNATAVDSSHAADLRFSYTVKNSGMDYAREICDLTFNIYIGDDENPAYTYFVASDLGGDGCFSGYEPSESHTISLSHAIPLSLEQMEIIDLGGTLRIVVEDYSYGADEYFYNDAAGAGILLAMEDGTDDGDESIQNFIIPTWGEETVLDVLGRYFPHTVDGEDNLTAIWTPEYRADTPAWCNDPQRTGSTLWCKHFLSTADWWNIYTNGMGDGSEGLQDTAATAGQTALFRFNQDSDLDGYSDRSEDLLGTDPEDTSWFPKPELLAGVHSIQNGNYVTSTLSLLNTGLYDAYGVEAVMVAPDDTISIINNTVGGSGRVKAQRQVVVGSQISLQSPLPSTWQQSGHAAPAAGGYYIGQQDRDYTFTVSCSNSSGCTVGSDTWTINWTDGAGSSGSLNFGIGYASPNMVNVGAFGVKLGLVSGTVKNGDAFTVAANTPRDTFQYIINNEPHSEPVVIVSYNDPQGNHRFIIPSDAMTLSSPEDNLSAFSGDMLPDAGVEIITSAPFSSGMNTTDLLVNNPSGNSFIDAHLFLEFINITGTVVSESPFTATLPSGPSVVPMSWNSDDFDPSYSSDQDYIVMAFWTDYEGNILDTAARPLSSFQEDPRPASDMAASDEIWDFGIAQQGTLMQHQVALASTGYMDLLTYMGDAISVTVDGPASLPISPADTAIYTMTLNTQYLPVGDFSEVIPIRTNDPQNPERTLTIQGAVTAMPEDATGGDILRPLDWTVTVTGTHSMGEWITFTHTLGPDAQSLHPVKVYSQDYSTLMGVGKYATDFGEGTASYDMFGNGSDGDLTISTNTTDAPIDSSCSGITGAYSLSATNASFTAGQKIMIHQSRGTNAGVWEINKIASYTAGTITTENPLENTYSDGGASQAQVLVLKQYRNVTVNSGVTWTVKAWDGDVGGILAFLANGTVNVIGTISANGGDGSVGSSGNPAGGYGGGFRGGNGDAANNDGYGGGIFGEGTNGLSYGNQTGANNGNGGGSGYFNNSNGANAAGGGNGTIGGNGSYGNVSIGQGGAVSGTADLTNIVFGGGGGSGSHEYGHSVGGGGAGGGLIFISASIEEITGIISANGGNGGNTNPGGGGGAGGSILLRVQEGALGTNRITASIGSGYGGSGNGGMGRIHLDYCTSYSGSTIPTLNTNKIDCYTIEQIETSPYNQTHLNLPETLSNSQAYQVQYGRRFVFASSGQQTGYIRLNRQMYGSASLDALISNTGIYSNSLILSMDFGNDGTDDWTYNAITEFPASLTVSGFESALNSYLLTRTDIPWGQPLDVPVKVTIDQGAQVILTNLALTPSGVKTRFLRLPADNYANLNFILNVTQPGVASGPLAIGVDVGADGSVDWSYAGNPSFPVVVSTTNLASAFNSYLVGRSGDVSVPIRIIPSPAVGVALQSFNSTPTDHPDLALSAGDISFSSPQPIESDTITVNAHIHNSGDLSSGPFIAAFFADAPDWGEWYIGSSFVPNISSGSNSTASIVWNTQGFAGDIPVRVQLDPYDRIDEASNSNNEAGTDIHIYSRADLSPIFPEDISQQEQVYIATITSTVITTLENVGETDSPEASIKLYQGNPDDNGVLVGEQTISTTAGMLSSLLFNWTPSTPGLYRLFLKADSENVVDEANRSNNTAWKDIYVGLKSPVELDSGVPSQDPVYSTSTGFGYVDENSGDVLTTCSSVSGEENTLRRDPDGSVKYQFDNLVPSHYYHLDLVLYECDGAGRQENVLVDSYQVAGPIDLGDGQVHRLSILVDPALYVDRSVEVVVEAPGIDGATVAAVNLYDVDYRYIDAGNKTDLEYTDTRGYGFVDSGSVALMNWGDLPYQTVRVDQNDDELSYRFDNLKAGMEYNVHLTFWQNDGAPRIQEMFIDGEDTNINVNSGDFEVHYVTIQIPTTAYESDGSVVVTVKRLGAYGAAVNEISLEEKTASVSSTQEVHPTPYFTDVYGSVLVDVVENGTGTDAPIGTVIQAYDPRGVLVGTFTVTNAGQYGYMRIYGEDISAIPSIEGMRNGELVTFKVNGAPAVSLPSFYWQDDRKVHEVNLQAGNIESELILLDPGWNLISLPVEPPSPLPINVLESIMGRYDRILGDDVFYSPTLSDTLNTLKQMHAGNGYYLHLNGTTSANLLVDGLPCADTTPIDLKQGWNWIGYYPDITLPITQSLESIAGKYQLVHSLELTYNPTDTIHSTLNYMSPNQGYLIYMDEATEFQYPDTSGIQGIVESLIQSAISSGVAPTPYLTVIYGDVFINGEPAPVGTTVEMISPDGTIAGYATIQIPGVLAYTHVYGVLEDETGGFHDGEVIQFRINGFSATPSTEIFWRDDRSLHPVVISTEYINIYLPFMQR